MPNPPRISANDLALFMVSSTTAQLGIVKRAKTPIIPPIIRYKDARPAITSYLTDPAKKLNPLVAAEQMFQQRVADMSESTLRRDDAAHGQYSANGNETRRDGTISSSPKSPLSSTSGDREQVITIEE